MSEFSPGTKVCSKCNQRLPVDDFHRRRKSPDGRQAACKPCNRAARMKSYRARPHKQVDYTATRLMRLRERMLDYLRAHPCVDCGEDDPIVLDFDHVSDEKSTEVSSMVHTGYSWSRIKAEIDKCEVVCANCHRRRTAIRDGRWYRTGYWSHGTEYGWRDRGCRCTECASAKSRHEHELQDIRNQRKWQTNHGTETVYRNGCRCDECRNAHRKKMKQYRQNSRNMRPHGTTTTYRTGCRCADCTKANTAAQRRRRSKT